MAVVTQTDPAGLKARMDAGHGFCLLDVREPWEVALASIPGSLCIPLHEIPARLGELDPGAEIIVSVPRSSWRRTASARSAT
jgi:sulfur-carrier protein adenylyltransferase/sulfurtransferase